MSTIGNAVFSASDDDDDQDYVPNNDVDSGSEREACTSASTTNLENNAEEEKAKKESEKATRASLWESFQASVSKSGPSSGGTTPSVNPKLVQVEKKYLFAGELVSEVVSVPEDSDEAKKWPLWDPSKGSSNSKKETKQEETTVDSSSVINPIISPPENENQTGEVSSTVAESSKPATPAQVGEPKVRRPGPRRPKGTLPPLPSSKPKKLTTLEKSAMDWKAHITTNAEGEGSSSNLADELEKNRRGGGYLERVAFLDRVSARREEIFDEGRKKRRKV